MEKIDAEYYDEIVNTYKGYNYVVRLQRRGHRCGYVQVPDDALFKDIFKKYNNGGSYGPGIECHGGLTYCHAYNKGYLEGDNWIGFDCAHLGDARDIETIKNIFIIPEDQLEFMIKDNPEGIPRSKEYVESHCKQIIDQLIELSNERKKEMDNTIELPDKHTNGCIECPYAKEMHHSCLESKLFILKYTPDKHYIIATCIGCGKQFKMLSAKYAESDIMEL